MATILGDPSIIADEMERLALEALGIQVLANWTDWRLMGSVPISAGELVVSSPSSEHEQNSILRFTLSSAGRMDERREAS